MYYIPYEEYFVNVVKQVKLSPNPKIRQMIDVRTLTADQDLHPFGRRPFVMAVLVIPYTPLGANYYFCAII
jgi:hypothetical protein